MWNILNICRCNLIVQVYYVVRLNDQMYKIIYFYDAGEVIPIINLCSEDLKAETFYKRFLLMCLLSYEGFNSFPKEIYISEHTCTRCYLYTAWRHITRAFATVTISLTSVSVCRIRTCCCTIESDVPWHTFWKTMYIIIMLV